MSRPPRSSALTAAAFLLLALSAGTLAPDRAAAQGTTSTTEGLSEEVREFVSVDAPVVAITGSSGKT